MQKITLDLQNQIQSKLAEAVALRHQIHQYPELKYEEVKTAELITNTLKSYGYTPLTGIAKTGVVAVLDSGKPGKTVALRADMDALPVTETSGLTYASQRPGLMHACGHDGHVATLLLVANVLRDFTDHFTGKIKFIFQPAEEGGNGAAAMIAAGVLENPHVDAIFGYHNLPTLKKNAVFVKPGCIMAGAIFFEIFLNGRGGHGAAPELCIDPVYAGSQIIQSLQSIVSRTVSPFETVVLSITQFHAGNANNVIPETAMLGGSFRFTDNELANTIQTKLEKIVHGVAESFGVKAKIEYVTVAPATINSTKEADFILAIAMELYGDAGAIKMQRNIMATEDFSFFLQKVPGCFFLVGTGENNPYCHTPDFQFDDDIIPRAAEMLSQAALRFLASSLPS